MITVAVEGDTDIPIVTKLCAAVGLDVREPVLDRGGKVALDAAIPGYAKAAHDAGYLVLRDLDNDAECAPTWLATNAPLQPKRFFRLRLAVRAIESWVMADAESVASSLHVPAHRVPIKPDDEVDPKLTLVNLARLSTKPAVRAALVPTAGMTRKAGRGYEGWLIELGREKWRVDVAVKRSPSLARARNALSALAVALREHARGK